MGAVDPFIRSDLHRRGVGLQDDLRVEQLEQCTEVASARGGQECVDDLAAALEAGLGGHIGALDPAPRPARQLPGRNLRAADDRSDVFERHREHVMQHKRHPLGGAQGLEHDEQRQADRVGHHRFMLRVRCRLDDRRVEWMFTSRLARTQHVEANTTDDGGQPTSQVLDTARIGTAQPQPRLLHGVIGLALRAEHAVGDRPQSLAVRFELFRHPVMLIHRSHSFVEIRLPG